MESTLADLIKIRLTQDFIGLVDVFESSDRTSIPVGSKWLAEVTVALNKADLHVVLCSPESIGRPWINFEAGAAHLRGIPIIPICHSGLKVPQLPVPLSESEGFLLSEAGALERLYSLIAKNLGSTVPSVDFAGYKQEIAEIESGYLVRHAYLGQETLGLAGAAIISNPVSLCVSSPQFIKLGFENQLQLVLNAFPSTLQHDRVLKSSELIKTLQSSRVDILHIAAFVCPRSGDLYFSEVDLRTGGRTETPGDVVTADALAALIAMAKTQLVVITSCDALALAATLLSESHVVAARDMVSSKMMAAWVEAFYSILPHKPLSQALDFAFKQSKAPMRLFAKQPKTLDVNFIKEYQAANA